MFLSNITTMKTAVYVITASMAIIAMATVTPCPPNTTFYGPGGLCYWEDEAQVSFDTAAALCRASHADGNLALLPFPHAEAFLVDTFRLSKYVPLNISHCQCTTWWTGYQVDANASVVSSTFGDPGTSWLPDLGASPFPVGSCVRVLPEVTEPPSHFRWYVGECDIQRRALCSSWAGQRSTTWTAEAGRLATHVKTTRAAVSRIHCAVQCRLQDGCASFNFHAASGTCELCSKVKSYPNVTTTFEPGYQHYEVIG